MYNLKFNGPFHLIDGVDKKTGEIINHSELPNLKQPGIYIWGFIYHSKGPKSGELKRFNNKENNPNFDKTTMKFIPYYVGETTNPLFDRLTDHQNVRKNASAKKYMRLSIEYLKSFYKDNDTNFKGIFPIHINDTEFDNGLKKLIEENKPKKTVEYFNNEEILLKIYGEGKIEINGTKTPKHYPITEQKYIKTGKPIHDTLYAIVGESDPNDPTKNKNMNNFWFCYATIPESEKGKLKLYESDTYFSLKGKTIGQTGTFKKKMSCTIIDNTGMEIFRSVSEVLTSPMKFVGDY